MLNEVTAAGVHQSNLVLTLFLNNANISSLLLKRFVALKCALLSAKTL